LKLLITSRAVLHLSGEHELAVPPLALPPASALALNGRAWQVIVQYPAIELFAQRARAVKPDFAITNENAVAVGEPCARPGGLPLAIELAATRSKLFTPQALLARLVGAADHTPLQLLTGGARDLPARQQTLRDTIAWSYDLLGAHEQALFRRL